MISLRVYLVPFLALCALAQAGCSAPAAAPPPQAAAPAASVPPAMVSYGQAMIAKINADPVLAQILLDYNVSRPLPVGLIVEPNGYVENSVMPVATGQTAGLQQAVGDHLIDVNFGNFLPGMPNRKLTFIVPVRPPPSASGQAGVLSAAVYSMANITLYQPNQMIAPRVSAPALANYIQRLNASVGAVIAAALPQSGVTTSLVMGVKPSCSSRAWLVLRSGTLPPAVAAQILTVAQDVKAMPVVQGPIAFAITFQAWGGGPPVTAGNGPPFPDAWKGVAGVVPDDIFAKIWP